MSQFKTEYLQSDLYIHKRDALLKCGERFAGALTPTVETKKNSGHVH